MTKQRRFILNYLLILLAGVGFAQVSVAQSDCETGNVKLSPVIPTLNSEGGSFPPSDFSNFDIFYKTQNGEASTEVSTPGDCIIQLDLPTQLMATAVAVDIHGQRSIESNVFLFTITEQGANPTLPDIPDLPAPPGGVDLNITVPEGYTVQVKVL